ncbi:MAG: phage tail assembly chaperone [Hyphomonadaceae bacterium]|nr:phage tail assembly chaperone [Hyphomonadaceae bacterium]
MKSEAWAEMLAAGCALGLAPDVVWRLSVREWRALTRGEAPAMTRDELEALVRAYPDQAP